jgi:hypothetical protein
MYRRSIGIFFGKKNGIFLTKYEPFCLSLMTEIAVLVLHTQNRFFALTVG